MSDDTENPFDVVTAPTSGNLVGRKADGRFRLSVVEGRDVGLAFDLDGDAAPRITIGQGASCEVRLTDRRVSRRHATLDVRGDGLLVADARSLNGTFVNGVSILSARLGGGELLRVGDTALAVGLVPSAGSSPRVTADHFGRVMGASIEMRRIFGLLERLARSDTAVLIEGESGTGKNLVAEAIHEASARAAGPLATVDCLARGDDRGDDLEAVVASAAGGTVVLDEVGALTREAQAHLLDAMGRADARLVATTRRNLDSEVAAGRFLDALLVRLDVGRVELPPLRHRDGDVGFLALRIWKRLGGGEPFPFDLVARYEGHDWPGNVRELETVLARRLAGADLEEPAPPARAAAQPEPDVVAATLALDLPLARARERVMADFERRYLAHTLARHGNNVVRAATAAGVARRYFQILKARYG